MMVYFLILVLEECFFLYFCVYVHTVLSLAGPVMALNAASRPEDDEDDEAASWSFPPITFLVTLYPMARRHRERSDNK